MPESVILIARAAFDSPAPSSVRCRFACGSGESTESFVKSIADRLFSASCSARIASVTSSTSPLASMLSVAAVNVLDLLIVHSNDRLTERVCLIDYKQAIASARFQARNGMENVALVNAHKAFGTSRAVALP